MILVVLFPFSNFAGSNMLGRGFCSESESRIREIFETKHLKYLENFYNKQIDPPKIEMSRKQYLDIFAKLSRSEFPHFLRWLEQERVRVSSGPCAREKTQWKSWVASATH